MNVLSFPRKTSLIEKSGCEEAGLDAGTRLLLDKVNLGLLEIVTARKTYGELRSSLERLIQFIEAALDRVEACLAGIASPRIRRPIIEEIRRARRELELARGII